VLTSAPIRISLEDKLDLLRRLDHQPWHSLDDHRLCMVCGRTVTGRQVEIIGGTRNHGTLRLKCPTPGCAADLPDAWAHLNRRPRAAALSNTSLPDHGGADGAAMVTNMRMMPGGQVFMLRRIKRAPHNADGATGRVRFVASFIARIRGAGSEIVGCWQRLRTRSGTAGGFPVASPS
jgi:hypothetical protein